MHTRTEKNELVSIVERTTAQLEDLESAYTQLQGDYSTVYTALATEQTARADLEEHHLAILGKASGSVRVPVVGCAMNIDVTPVHCKVCCHVV